MPNGLFQDPMCSIFLMDRLESRRRACVDYLLPESRSGKTMWQFVADNTSEEQQSILLSKSTRKCISAAAGSGKTRTLVYGLLSELAGTNGIVITDQDRLQPNVKSREEWTLRQFCSQHFQDSFDFARFDKWWVPDKYKNPTWDLLATCAIKGRRGLLLVEAKAHEGELHFEGKELEENASEQSLKNHERIRQCIEQANEALNVKCEGFDISIDKCYQLSNRVASAWKLAECGLPVVLLYLGFVDDRHFSDHFVDHKHWQRMMGAYMRDVVPLSFPGRAIEFDNGETFMMLIKSFPAK